MGHIRLKGFTGMMLAAGALVAGSSADSEPSGERVVFTVATGFSQGGPATTIDVVDVGLPELHNLSAHRGRLRKVTLVSVLKAVDVHSITAYSYLQTGGGVGIITRDLFKRCPQNAPHPLTDAVTAPHADSSWHVVVAMTFPRPGRYNIRRAKIYYTSDGQRGWRYQNLNTTIVVTAARKGAKPAFDGCP
jgi:hypothetical protein